MYFKKLEKNRSCEKKNLLISYYNGYSDFFYSEKAPMTSRISLEGVTKRIHRMDDVKKINIKCCKLNSSSNFSVVAFWFLLPSIDTFSLLIMIY